MENTIDIQKTLQAVEIIAEELGIDLTAYGNASPTKLILQALTSAVEIMQQTTQLALTEQNPLTAMNFRSRYGLAALVGLNATQLMVASSGKVRVQVNGHTCTVGQHAKLISQDNIDYYAVLSADTVKFDKDTELMIKQGTMKQMNFIATGEAWEAFALEASNYIDVSSIEVYKGTEQMKLGYKIDEQADIYVRPDYTGKVQLIVDRQHTLEPGTSLTVLFADCIGVEGDNMEIGQLMNVSAFAYEGDTDISSEIQVYICEPVIGGTDFANFDQDLSNSIMLSGHNNLIGSEAQLLQYVKRFKQYAIQSIRISNGVFAIYALRSLAMLVKTMDYFTACENLTLRAEDVLSLSNHLNKYANKSLDMAISVKHALQEHCRVNVIVNMEEPSIPMILDVVTQYLIDKYADRSYDTATLYKRLIVMPGVSECVVTFDGNLNMYGTAVPSVNEAILVCTAANITVNGVTQQFGTYTPTNEIAVDTIVRDVTAERILETNENLLP